MDKWSIFKTYETEAGSRCLKNVKFHDKNIAIEANGLAYETYLKEHGLYWGNIAQETYLLVGFLFSAFLIVSTTEWILKEPLIRMSKAGFTNLLMSLIIINLGLFYSFYRARKMRAELVKNLYREQTDRLITLKKMDDETKSEKGESYVVPIYFYEEDYKTFTFMFPLEKD